MIVLGIDAAWTATQPSGVALVTEQGGGWELVTVAASYQRFVASAGRDLMPEARPSGGVPDPSSLLATCTSLLGKAPDLVAIDMPLSREKITSRRVSDDAVSRAYGGRKAGTHTPSASRPGPISDELTLGFHHAGYPLQTTSIAAPGLIEVYPHPALIELTGATERLPYKVAKARRYWPTLSPVERRARLYAKWREIVIGLETEITGVTAALPALSPEASGIEAKAYEDMLDAVVCAWVGVRALQGRAKAFGNEQSAIWIPTFR